MPYAAGEIDYFFIVCEDESKYLIPAADILGRFSLTLDAKYANYRVE